MQALTTIPLALLLTAPLAAGAILTVGPTGQFAEIQDALDAAQPGDVLLVQPGTYHEIVIDQPVRILGSGSGDVIISATTNGIVVSGIPAGEEVVVSGIEVRANPIVAPVQASVVLANNAGTVVLHDLRVSYQFSKIAVAADACARVLLLRAELLDAGTYGSGGDNAAVAAHGSELWIANSTITGEFGASGFAEDGDHAVSVENGSLHVWRSTLLGGDGVPGKGFFETPDGGDGIRATSSSVTLYGGPVGEVRGGDGALGSPFAGNGVGGAGLRLSAGSTARVQQDLPLFGGLNPPGGLLTPAVVADGTSSFLEDPFVFATLTSGADQTSVGGSFALEVNGHAGGIAVVFVSLETGPTLAIPGVGGLGVLNPGLFLQVAAVGLGGAGGAIINVNVPPLAGLLGATFFFQGAEASPAGLSITNPALVSVSF